MSAPVTLGDERIAEAARPLDGPGDVGLRSGEHTFRTRVRVADRMATGKIRSLLLRGRKKGRAAVPVGRALARSSGRAVDTGVLAIPSGGEFPLVPPERAGEHAVVLLHTTVRARVANQCADVVDRDPMPLVHLSLGGVRVVRKWLAGVEDLPDASHPVHARTDGLHEVLRAHLGGVVDGPVPLGRLPVSRLDPADAIRVVSHEASIAGLGSEGTPLCLLWRVLHERRAVHVIATRLAAPARSGAESHNRHQRREGLNRSHALPLLPE